MAESATDYAMCILDKDGKVVDWNIGAERILCYTEAEIVGRDAAIIYTPEDREKKAPEQELHEAATEGRAENERWHVRKDGSRFWGSGIVMPLRDEVGALIGFAKVMRDFTERKRAEEERNQLLQRERQAREEAVAANRAKDDFMAMVSHELRSPLNTILGWTGVLLSGQADAAIQRQALEVIQRSALSQNQLINDLLDVARISSGKIRMDLVPVDLPSLAATAIENIRPEVEAKSIALELTVDPAVEPVAADPNRLQQVMRNLLGNAVKFTPRGGRIEVRLERDNSHSLIQVIDTGIGISPEFLPHIFEQYRQRDTSSARDHTGLGLGLSIVKQLVQMHDGTVQAKSPGEGQGATFTVRLPALSTQSFAD